MSSFTLKQTTKRTIISANKEKKCSVWWTTKEKDECCWQMTQPGNQSSHAHSIWGVRSQGLSCKTEKSINQPNQTKRKTNIFLVWFGLYFTFDTWQNDKYWFENWKKKKPNRLYKYKFKNYNYTYIIIFLYEYCIILCQVFSLLHFCSEV